LKENDVREIKRRLHEGETTIKLASDYGVHHSSIQKIKQSQNWRHVT
jgi:hypothetical protein